MKMNMLSAAVSALLIAGCQQQSTTVTTPPFYVSTVIVAAPVDTQQRTFKGQVMAAEQTPLAFRSGGEVTLVHVKAGDNVKKGDLLAQLDDKAVKQTLLDAQGQYDMASNQLRRGQELFSNAMISQMELDELAANHALADAQYQQAKNQLSYTRLVAPFSGTISIVAKERFERVQPGESVVSLYKDDKVHVKFELSDNALATLTPQDQQVHYQPWVSFAGLDGRYRMTHLEHSVEPNAATGSYEMWFEMAQPSITILPGTTATVKVDLADAGLRILEGHQVPMTVLQPGETKGHFNVWKLRDNTAKRIGAEVIEINGDGAVIIADLEQGDRLINSNLRQLREGKHVVATERSNG